MAVLSEAMHGGSSVQGHAMWLSSLKACVHCGTFGIFMLHIHMVTFKRLSCVLHLCFTNIFYMFRLDVAVALSCWFRLPTHVPLAVQSLCIAVILCGVWALLSDLTVPAAANSIHCKSSFWHAFHSFWVFAQDLTGDLHTCGFRARCRQCRGQRGSAWKGPATMAAQAGYHLHQQCCGGSGGHAPPTSRGGSQCWGCHLW